MGVLLCETLFKWGCVCKKYTLYFKYSVAKAMRRRFVDFVVN